MYILNRSICEGPLQMICDLLQPASLLERFWVSLLAPQASSWRSSRTWSSR